MNGRPSRLRKYSCVNILKSVKSIVCVETRLSVHPVSLLFCRDSPFMHANVRHTSFGLSLCVNWLKPLTSWPSKNPRPQR